MSHDETILRGSGNVFADLGLPNPDEEMAKAKLALAVLQQIDARGLTQAQAAALIGTASAKIGQLRRGKLSPFTYEHLVRFLKALGCDVEITVTPSKSPTEERPGQITVAA